MLVFFVSTDRGEPREFYSMGVVIYKKDKASETGVMDF